MYGKLFAQMYDGTLATKGPWQALITFQQLIILADQDGVVDMTPEAINRRTTVPLRHILTGLAALEQPDPESRTPAAEGRRITRISDSREWGWQIVNYDHYRKIRSEDERREYQRNLMRERRASAKENRPVSNGDTALAPVSNVSPSSKQYVEVEALTPLPPKQNSKGGGKLQAGELLTAVRASRNPQFPNSLARGALEAFSPVARRVVLAVGIERILSTVPANDGPLLAQVTEMLREAAA